MGLARGQRVGRHGNPAGKNVAIAQQRSQRHQSEADAAFLEKVTARDRLPRFVPMMLIMSHRLHSFVIVSSIFNSTRDTIVQAATLCKLTSGGGFFESGEATSTAWVV